MVSRFRYPTGGVRALLFLFVPLALTTLSNCLFLFVEKILLGRLSIHEMEAAVNAAYAWQIFQVPCLTLVMAAPVYIARCWGKGKCKAIGPGVWQFIWFCLLSMLVTTPLGTLFGYFYFRGTEIESFVYPYFYFLLGINFISPLITSLTSFYIAQGKTHLVLWATLASQVVKICLAYVLILGWNNWIPEMGLMGGVISTLIAQGGLSLVLLGVFLNQKNASIFQSREWRLQPRLFWECIESGLLRAINRISTLLCWAAIAHLMSVRGGEYLLALSIGGALFFFFPFVSDAILQAETTIASQILGARQYSLINRAFNSANFLVVVMIGIFAIPCLIFPTATFQYLFPTIQIDGIALRNVFFGAWLSFAFFTLVYIPISHLLALKDAKFFLFMGAMSWINGYLLMYIAIETIEIRADQFWIALSLMHATTFVMYYWRLRWVQRRDLSVQLLEAVS